MFFKDGADTADPVELSLAGEEGEEDSKRRALELFESGLLDHLETGTFKSLSKIHRHLFCHIFDFAGKLRTVNIARGSFRFVPVLYLREAVAAVERMPQSSFEEIIEKYVEMNVVHPFRDGNGRSARIWLDVILKKELRQAVDWSRVDKDEYLLAMERSPAVDTGIKILLLEALTDKIRDRDVYAKGIEASYFFEECRILEV